MDGVATRKLGYDSFNVLTHEKLRGGVSSFISGLVANVANAGLIMMGVNPLVSTALTLQVAGNLLTYFLDIMIAKRDFGGVSVPYDDLSTRYAWLLRSFAGPPFHKFIVAAIIELVIVYASLAKAIIFCDKHGIKFWMRDAALAGAIAGLSFLLVMNILRFNWVFNETESITLNIVVLAWMGLSVLLFLLVPVPSASGSASVTGPLVTTAHSGGQPSWI